MDTKTLMTDTAIHIIQEKERQRKQDKERIDTCENSNQAYLSKQDTKAVTPTPGKLIIRIRISMIKVQSRGGERVNAIAAANRGIIRRNTSSIIPRFLIDGGQIRAKMRTVNHPPQSLMGSSASSLTASEFIVLFILMVVAMLEASA